MEQDTVEVALATQQEQTLRVPRLDVQVKVDEELVQVARDHKCGGGKYLVMDPGEQVFISRHASARKAYSEAGGDEVAVAVLDKRVLPIVSRSDLRIFKVGIIEEDAFGDDIETDTYYVAAPNPEDVVPVIYEDMRMRGLDGREALQKIRHLEEPKMVSIEDARNMRRHGETMSMYERFLDRDQPCVLRHHHHGPFK